MKKYEMILKAKDIPEGMTVTKVTGEKEYRLNREIIIHGYDADPNRQPIKAEEGTVFLCPSGEWGSLHLSSIPDKKKLKVEFTLEQLEDFVGQQRVLEIL